jgi:AbrB family looped-hinge helix DNA binding protein
MGAQIKVLQKGKVTIPVEMREALGVEEGDYLTVELQSGKVVIYPSGTVAKPTEAIAGLASGVPISEPVDQEIRRAAAERVRNKMERARK